MNPGCGAPARPCSGVGRKTPLCEVTLSPFPPPRRVSPPCLASPFVASPRLPTDTSVVGTCACPSPVLGDFCSRHCGACFPSPQTLVQPPAGLATRAWASRLHPQAHGALAGKAGGCRCCGGPGGGVTAEGSGVAGVLVEGPLALRVLSTRVGGLTASAPSLLRAGKGRVRAVLTGVPWKPHPCFGGGRTLPHTWCQLKTRPPRRGENGVSGLAGCRCRVLGGALLPTEPLPRA